MLIPRSGLSGLALNMLDKQYNTISEKHNLYADQVYDVPFIGQNHTNLCGDAAAYMLARWAKHVLPGVTNLKYQSHGYSNLRDFFKDVASFKRKSTDKLRDEAVKIFDKYLNPDPAAFSAKTIIQVCKIETSSNLFTDLAGQIETCRERKRARDIAYSGITNRWLRHTTKKEGYVVTSDLFDPLVAAIQAAFFYGSNVAEFINNPRATPLSGLTADDITEQYGSLLSSHEAYDPCPFQTWTDFMDRWGPVFVVRVTHINGIGNVGHCLVVTGYVRNSQFLIYHDPWRGPDKRVIYTELYDNIESVVFTINDRINPLRLNQR
jgi:hypothetical protein